MQTGLTSREAAIVAVVRSNDAAKRVEIRREWRAGKLSICFSWRSANNVWGRFGAGWNWIVGFQVGGSSWVLNLLVCSLRISWSRR